MRYLKTLSTLLSLSASAVAAEPEPTEKNVAYGIHERQVLDFYQADSRKPTPLVLHIHGGGWINGDKKDSPGLEKYLNAGISVTSINYCYTLQAQGN